MVQLLDQLTLTLIPNLFVDVYIFEEVSVLSLESLCENSILLEIISNSSNITHSLILMSPMQY